MCPDRLDLDDRAGERAIRRHLEVIRGRAPASHFIELRFRVADQRLASVFHPVGDTSAIATEILDRARRTDVYVGCAPRNRRSGTKDAVEQVWTLWAECDGDASVRRLHEFRPRPVLVIASGTGRNCHAYWPLSEPLSPRAAEAANLRLTRALGADPVCFDASRILRPPATWNFKHNPPTPVAVLRMESGRRLDVGEVVASLPAIDEEQLARRWEPRLHGARDDPLLAIPPRVYVVDLLGVEPARNGKVRCPFHDDRHPSLHVYTTGERGWCCFSCRRGGTIYDLAAAVWGIGTRGREFIELRARLLERYERDLRTARLTRSPEVAQ